MATKSRRVGILTSGGDCPGMNAVIRGVVKSATQLGYETIGFLKGYEGLIDPVQFVTLDKKNTTGILHLGGTILGTTNQGRFAVLAGVGQHRSLDPKVTAGVQRTIEDLDLRSLVCVGGDGSMGIAEQLHQSGIPVIGVPKTIDNDLSVTAFSFGFDSALACATDALDRLHTTAASHDRIMVLEVMGRHAGWIAVYSGIAGGGDVILIPEISWTFEHICDKVRERERDGKHFTLIVAAEGAKLPDGRLVCQEEAEGRQVRLGGIGDVIATELKARLKRDTRCVVLGHLQRGGSPTTMDRVLATQFGAHAMRLVHHGRFGEMVCFDPPQICSVSLKEAIRLSVIDPNGSAVNAARALGISFGDRALTESPFELD